MPSVSTNIGWEDRPNPKKLEWIDEFIDCKREPRVLDLGAGKGWYSLYLAERGCNVTSIDIEPQFDREDVILIQASLEEPLDFEDETFDYVLAWDIIEHVENETQLLNEINRVLNEEGLLLASVPNADDSRIADSYLTYCHFKDKTHEREYTVKELRRKLQSIGLDTVSIQLTGGEGFPYALLCFVDNVIARIFLKFFIKSLMVFNIVQVKDCHGDIFAVGKKTRQAE